MRPQTDISLTHLTCHTSSKINICSEQMLILLRSQTKTHYSILPVCNWATIRSIVPQLIGAISVEGAPCQKDMQCVLSELMWVMLSSNMFHSLKKLWLLIELTASRIYLYTKELPTWPSFVKSTVLCQDDSSGSSVHFRTSTSKQHSSEAKLSSLEPILCMPQHWIIISLLLDVMIVFALQRHSKLDCISIGTPTFDKNTSNTKRWACSLWIHFLDPQAKHLADEKPHYPWQF